MTAHSNARPNLEGKEGRIVTHVTVISAMEYPTGTDVHVVDNQGNRFWIAEDEIEWEVEIDGTDQTSSRTAEINDQGE
ncbi:hypothetical protein ACTHQ4_02195 [Alkalicoccobacillus gibsonii]|uniref:hypothetical protein n=1 Tax=Alkalicoccobacillus gibsonii TaxID=79881 RepID=UPI003F7C7976